MNRPTPEPISPADLDTFTRAYLECALWASTDNGYLGADDPRNNARGAETGGEPLDKHFGIDDIAPESLASAAKECRDFRDYCARVGLDLSPLDDEQAGHDFFLTRNGHGAGFWDRGLGKLGEDLSAACKTFGGADFYVGDDGRVYTT